MNCLFEWIKKQSNYRRIKKLEENCFYISKGFIDEMRPILISILLILVSYSQNESLEIVVEFNNLNKNSSESIKNLKKIYGVEYKGDLFGNFHIIQKKFSKKAKRDVNEEHEIDFLNKLKLDASVKSFQVQRRLIREKRNVLNELAHALLVLVDEARGYKHNERQDFKARIKCGMGKYYFDDPEWPYQWYMNDGCEEGVNLNVTAAWDLGFTGKNVVVTIIDDGVEKSNLDLADNFDQHACTDLNDNDNNAEPRYDSTDENKHGTRCAGEISMAANNSICGVGIAYNSRIGGIRLLDGRINDRLEAAAISFNTDYIDIFSASWGPLDNGKTVEGPGKLTSLAFLKGINEGRNKKGSIYVWASGNGGRYYDNCNCDGYTASIYTITISSVTQQNSVTPYSEKCSSILATTYSSGKNGNSVVTSDLRNRCTKSHSGTSASAPIAAGIISLALEANRYLTWRDVQYLIVYTSNTTKLVSNNWGMNGVGRQFSHEFGFGLMNAGRLVELATRWVNIGEQIICNVNIFSNERIEIGDGEAKEIDVTVELFKTCNKQINYLEHVISSIGIESDIRGSLYISLESPSKTVSNLLDYRPFDQSKSGFQNWPFMSVHYWGENPNGEWVLTIKNSHSRPAYLSNWTLIFHGVEYLNS